MRLTNASELSLLKEHARQLEQDPSLDLDREKAKLAIAILWDFPSWADLESSVRDESVDSSIRPSELMRKPGSETNPETTAIVLRQAGRIINQMLLFPKLSEKVGQAIPRLYGYDSMYALSKAGPLSLETTPDEAMLHRQASNDGHSQESLPIRAFTGAGLPGFSLVVGGEQDRPLAFTLNEAITRAAGAPIRIFMSDTKAQGFRLAFESDQVTIESAPSISDMRDSLKNFLRANNGALGLLSLDGFPDRDRSELVFSELASLVRKQVTAHLMVVAETLRSVPVALWQQSRYQVLLSQSLAGYPESRNPHELTPTIFSQVLGFTSNRTRDFTYLVLEETRNGQLIYSGIDKMRPVSNPRPRECSA